MKSELKRFYQRAAASLRTAKIAPPSAHKGRLLLTLLMMLLTTATAWAQEAIDGLTYNTTGGYYEINDEQDLIDLATYVNAGNNASGKTFLQTLPITMTGSNFTPIGIGYKNNKSDWFAGTYDGGGHTISGLSVSYSLADVGFFSNVYYGTVRNVILVSPSVTNTKGSNISGFSVGALIGYTFDGTVENCLVISPTLNATGSGDKYYGALVGESGSSDDIFTNCCYYTDNASLAGIGKNPKGDVSRAYTVTLGDGVTTSTAAAFTCNGTDYYKSGAIVTLPAAPAGYINAYTVNGSPIDGTSFTISADATVALSRTLDPADFADNGDGTYTIKTATGWSVFCDCLDDNDTYNRFSGKTVRLADDITVTRMAGSDHHDFCGTFDGQGHTLTLDISSDSRPYTAPFAYVSETTPTGGNEVSHPAIRNLNVTGTVNATKVYASGLVGAFWGTLTIENCTSSVTVNTSNKYAAGFISNAQGNAIIRNCLSSATINSTVSGDGTHAGFIGVAGSVNLNIEGCAFTGSLLGTSTTSCAGFVGYGGTVTITNSLYAPAEVTVQNDNSATFARGNTPSTTNCYYTAALGDAQGKATRTVAAATDVTIEAVALTGTATQYTVSGITAYSGGGLQRGETLYYGSGDQLSLTLSNTATAPLGYQYDGYIASAGTLSGSTLTMPDEDVTISVNTAAPSSTGQPVAVAYVDADGTLHDGDNAAQAVALDGSETSLAAGTYFVGLPEVNFTHTLNLEGNVTLILKDGCAMNVGTDAEKISATGIDGSDYAIDIYAQSLGNDKGTLAIYTKGTNHRGISVGDVNVNGGNVNVNNGAQGIFARGDITVNGGSVTVNSTAPSCDAIQTPKGDITINGGTVNATGTKNGIYAAGSIAISGGNVKASGGNNWYGIFANVSVAICGGIVEATGGASGISANNGITLGWTNYSDRITANGYSGIVSVKAGQAFVTDEATPAVIGGTVSDLAAINGKTLKPATFYLVGNMTNPEWTVNADYQLTINPGNTSELMIQNVPLTGSTEFKVVYSANGTEATTWYPGDWYNYWISADGIYDIYFRPDYQGGDDWHFGCIYATDVSNIEVAFAPEGFATYYHGTFDVKLPEGVKARIVTARGDSEGTLTYETIADGDTDNNKVVPAGTAVMLQTEKSTEAQQKTLTLAAHGDNSPAAPTLNLLHGSDVEGTTTGDGKHYKLTYGNDNTPNAEVFGWYWGAADGAAFTSPAHKAWLVLPADANARSFFGLPDDDTTTIIENGKLKIENSNADAWYDLSGRKLDNGQRSMVNGQWSKVNGQWSKGIYIRGGKKVVIK